MKGTSKKTTQNNMLMYTLVAFVIFVMISFTYANSRLRVYRQEKNDIMQDVLETNARLLLKTKIYFEEECSSQVADLYREKIAKLGREMDDITHIIDNDDSGDRSHEVNYGVVRAAYDHAVKELDKCMKPSAKKSISAVKTALCLLHDRTWVSKNKPLNAHILQDVNASLDIKLPDIFLQQIQLLFAEKRPLNCSKIYHEQNTNIFKIMDYDELRIKYLRMSQPQVFKNNHLDSSFVETSDDDML